MTQVECVIVRWVADNPQPGLVEVHLTDADGRRWSFVQKCAYFTADLVLPSSEFPLPGTLECAVVGDDHGEVVTVDTGDFDSDGVSVFRVPARLVR